MKEPVGIGLDLPKLLVHGAEIDAVLTSRLISAKALNRVDEHKHSRTASLGEPSNTGYGRLNAVGRSESRLEYFAARVLPFCLLTGTDFSVKRVQQSKGALRNEFGVRWGAMTKSCG